MAAFVPSGPGGEIFDGIIGLVGRLGRRKK